MWCALNHKGRLDKCYSNADDLHSSSATHHEQVCDEGEDKQHQEEADGCNAEAHADLNSRVNLWGRAASTK
jgi:hypothetical protein